MKVACHRLLHLAGIAATFLTFLLCAATLSAAAAEPKQVLILHSSGRDFSQWNEYAKNIRAELDRRSPKPLDIYETSLATAQFIDDQIEGPFVDYLRPKPAQWTFRCGVCTVACNLLFRTTASALILRNIAAGQVWAMPACASEFCCLTANLTSRVRLVMAR
jgi:hypothetical protein